jgi:V/A-type H+-transporting ATPase subunit D
VAINVNPTRMELSRLKRRLKMAVRGHKLLKDKTDEMVRRFVLLVRKNMQLRVECEGALAAAMERFSNARAFMGDASINEALYYPVKNSEVLVGTKNIMSVYVPTLEQVQTDQEVELPYSFAFSSSELDGAVIDLSSLLTKLIELAEIEKSCDMLADEIEKTRRRVNALEYVMIPEMETSIRYIKMKLDENERGNLVRLRKVKDMLEQDRA